MTDQRRRATEREYIRETDNLLRGAPPKLSALTAYLLEQAEAQARARDDNHVWTVHLMLGLYAVGETTARRKLESLGISWHVFADQLECEEGPSGEIPLTPRARMILALRELRPWHLTAYEKGRPLRLVSGRPTPGTGEGTRRFHPEGWSVGLSDTTLSDAH